MSYILLIMTKILELDKFINFQLYPGNSFILVKSILGTLRATLIHSQGQLRKASPPTPFFYKKGKNLENPGNRLISRFKPGPGAVIHLVKLPIFYHNVQYFYALVHKKMATQAMQMLIIFNVLFLHALSEVPIRRLIFYTMIH